MRKRGVLARRIAAAGNPQSVQKRLADPAIRYLHVHLER